MPHPDRAVNFYLEVSDDENYSHSSIPESPIPVEFACTRCFSQQAEIHPVAAHLPHAGGLYCQECGGWIKWLGAAQKAALLAQGGVA
jgi:hypothetical protein